MSRQDIVRPGTERSALGDEDALQFRRLIYGGGTPVKREDVETLFRLNAAAKTHSPGWRRLFVDATTDLLVHQAEPAGYLGEESGDWLISMMRTHLIKGDEIELLVHVLEQADATGERFSSFVLDVAKRFALWSLQRFGRLDHVAVETLRRVVFAKGGDQNIGVTRREAEALFEVNAATRDLPTDPAWKEFFVRAVAACVLSAPVWKADATLEAQEQRWLADPRQLLATPWSHPNRFAERLVSGERDDAARIRHDGMRETVRADLISLRRQTPDIFNLFGDHVLDKRVAADEATLADAAILTDDEADWLLSRIEGYSAPDENEEALISFILANASSASPKLKAGLERLSR